MPRKPAHVRMMNKAVDYLGRYASSSHKLGQILQRFASRRLADYDADDIAAAIQQTIDQCEQLGYLDDRQFAVTVARGQRRLGRSQSVIRQRLRQHALGDDIIIHALASHCHACAQPCEPASQPARASRPARPSGASD